VLFNADLDIGSRKFVWGQKTYLMGILNLTPDSFSGDGLFARNESDQGELNTVGLIDVALKQAQEFVAAGADILDIGGESTRPGAAQVDWQTELQRVVPVVQALVKEFEIPISIDTYKHQVAQAALEAGAHLINDVWGLKADADIAKIIAQYEAPAILMHNRSSWAHADIKDHLGGRYIGVPYEHLIEDIKRELIESVEIAHSAGIPDERIIIDPGIGFGKTVEQNLELINLLPVIRSLGYPLLYGPSRKSFIGYTLDQPPEQRLAGTAAAVAVGIVRGADIIRVHDVAFMRQVAQMTDAIVR
jgi:dihydropteroate synthase